MIDLIELQTRIHKQNVEMGWWDNPRPFSTFICLFHSELSEAMEGDRKGLMDDHLTQYPMFQVELADFVIRVFDWLGNANITKKEWDDVISEYNEDSSKPWESGCHSNTGLLAELHSAVSSAYMCMDNQAICDSLLAGTIICSFSYALENNFDLLKIINEKVEYNKHRADHKRENRAKEGGKKY